MLDLVRGEWLKARTGRAGIITLGSGLSMCLLISYGYASEGDTNLTAGLTDLATVTNDIARAWMMLFLFASIFAALLVTREYSSGTMARSVLLGGNRSRVFLAKLLAGTGAGIIFGLLSALFAAISPWLLLSTYGRETAWTEETTLTVAGVFLCNVLAALWGVTLAWVIRNQVAAVLTIMTLTMLVDPGLQRLVPDASSYLFTIALSSIYRDGKPELLSVPIAFLVIAGWLVVAGFVGRKAFLSRDLT